VAVLHDKTEPVKFFIAGAIEGRLRFHGLPASGSWDPSRLTYRTAQDPEMHLSRGPGWVVTTDDELDHALDCSFGISRPIILYIHASLLLHAQRKWEGNAP